jgi:hypothetical protein
MALSIPVLEDENQGQNYYLCLTGGSRGGWQEVPIDRIIMTVG